MIPPQGPPKRPPSVGRWHRSTYVFLGAVVLVLFLLNLPGQFVLVTDFSEGKCGPHFGFDIVCEHGWPLTYMRRYAEVVMPGPPPWRRLSRWRLFEGVDRFNASSLIADAVLGLALACAFGFLFEWWRRRRKRLLQFYLDELLILVAIVAGCAAVFVWHRSQHRSELTALQEIERTPKVSIQWGGSITERTEWTRAGPAWLRQLIGDRPFQVFDRVVVIETAGEELEHVVKLRDLKVVRLVGPASKRQLRLLEALPELEALDMFGADPEDEGQEVVGPDGNVLEAHFSLPRLPNLRGLNLYDTAFRGDGLENIPSIEVLDLTDTGVDDTCLPALAALTELKRLALHGTGISDSGIEQLRRALPDCEILGP